MKMPNKNKVIKQKTKKKPNDKNKKEQVLVVAQEFKFARLLSGNEKKTRDRVLKTLKKWLLNCFEKGYGVSTMKEKLAFMEHLEFKEDDFIRVWKGLFYAVWMSDKPLVQEELCESIAEILDLFGQQHLEHAILMTKTGLKVLAIEWYGIDQHRMDKFLMLVRRYLRGSLRCLQRCKWSLQSCQAYSKMLMASDGILCVKTPQYARNAMSMILHFIDCYLEEIAKVSEGAIPEASLAALLLPITSQVCGGEALVLCVAARRLFTALLRQSDRGLQYQEATRAWQKMGCPVGGPEALELVSDDEEENEEAAADDSMNEHSSALDPRAGRVDVLLPLLPVPAALLADQLRKLMAQSSSKAYKRASICLERFEALSKDEYPLVVPEMDVEGAESFKSAVEPGRAARRLRALEKNLVAQSDELALRGLKRKHRKRLLARSRAGLSIVDEVSTLTDTQANSTDGDWQIEETQPQVDLKNKKADSSNKENEVIKKKGIRKRKALEVRLDKAKKVKSVNNVIPKSKVMNKTELTNGKEPDKKANLSKNESVVNGNINKEKVKKEKKPKDNKSPATEKIRTRQDKIVKNLPKLTDTHKPANNTSKAKIVIDNKEESKKDLLDNTKQKIDLANVVDKKLTRRQKVLPLQKIKNYQKQTVNDKTKEISRKKVLETQKKVKFVLKNNSMQGTVDYYKSVRQSPNIPFDSSKKPSKTNLKVSTPSPINPFFKKKMKIKF